MNRYFFSEGISAFGTDAFANLGSKGFVLGRRRLFLVTTALYLNENKGL